MRRMSRYNAAMNDASNPPKSLAEAPAESPAARVRRVTVAPQYEGQRIDNFLLRELGATQGAVPRTLIYRILRTGEVRINSQRAKPTTRLRAGDEIRIPPVTLAPRTAPITDLPAAWLARVPGMIVREDDDLLVVNKPAGLAVHGGSGIPFGLIELLRTATGLADTLELAHRIDRETSGLVLLAKNRPALHALQAELRPEGRAQKRYQLLVHGRWPPSLRQVDAPLEKWQGEGHAHRVQVDSHGKTARTEFLCLEHCANSSFMQAELHTGRTHQIRVHAAHVGHPLVGDEKYGQRALDKAFGESERPPLMLHAAQLTLPHPRTGQRMSVRAVPPLAWQAVLQQAGLSATLRHQLFCE